MLIRTLWRRPRIVDVERRFFDAYSRGGGRDPSELVIPLDWFSRPEVEQALGAWWRGAPLDIDALHRAWRAAVPDADDDRFYRNLAFLLAQAQRA